MERRMSTVQEKYEMIRQHQERFAFELAKTVLDKPKASVWIIFLPVLFVFHAQRIQKYKQHMKEFVKGYLVTKNLALEAAWNEIRNGPPGPGEGHYPEPPPGEYFKTIREKQIVELELLREHYLLLLRSSGDSYERLLRNAYRGSGDYRYFLNRLTKAEAGINRTVLDVRHQTEEARDIVERMESGAERLREKEIEKIFG
jgi:hypothetical protein